MPAPHAVLFDSFSRAPVQWRDICSSDDLAMDVKALSVFQRTLKDQCRCWGLIIFDASGTAVGCAALCAFRVRPLKVLFCGLPVPAGSTHLRARPGACMNTVVREVHHAMQRLAQATRCHLLIFKELDDISSPAATALSRLGYIHGEIPASHRLERKFASFAEYRDSLKSRYRAQVQRSQKKLSAAGFEVLQGRGNDFFTRHFDETAYWLYVEIHRRAKHKLELLPAAFFHGLAEELDKDIALTLIRRNGRACAFTFAITRAPVHYNLYSGLDYAVNNEGDLYFNLFYHDMDQAFRAGAATLHLGQTSDAFKSRLGTNARPLYFFARAASPLLHPLLHLAAPAVFPKVTAVEPHSVFAAL